MRSNGPWAWTSSWPRVPARTRSRPGPTWTRFTDAADSFAGYAEEPTLGAFLAYLSAAETEEFGLETGRVGETDSVKLATVHTSKGLQWAAVLVPGLAAGERSQVFPARPRLSTRWTDNPRLLPFGLRGDSADLPSLRDLDPASVRRVRPSAARTGTWPRSAASSTWPRPGPRSGWAVRATGGGRAPAARTVPVPERGPRGLPGTARGRIDELGRRHPSRTRSTRRWPSPPRPAGRDPRRAASRAVREGADLVARGRATGRGPGRKGGGDPGHPGGQSLRPTTPRTPPR